MSTPDTTVPPGSAEPPASIPPLPENATPEQKDEHWFKHVYAGDKVPQLTLRAVLMGGVLGMVMSLSNLYTMLQVGWLFGVAITACVLSFVIWNSMRALSGGRLSPMSLLENNCMQSTASAAGYTTGSTVGTAFGALLLITGSHQPWYYMAPFVLLSASLGVFIAIPMKRQMINYEQLKFPSGIAAAETLRSLYSRGVEAVHKAWSLVIALGLGGLIGLLRTWGTLIPQLKKAGRPHEWLERIQSWLRIPEEFAFGGFLNPLARGHMTGLAFEPSALLVAAGMIIGTRVCLSMLLGAVLLYYVVAPQLLALDAASAGVAGYVPSFSINAAGDFYPVRWALWGGTSVMVFSSLAAVALEWRTISRAFHVFKKGQKTAQSDAVASIEVPATWLIAGLIPITIGMVIVEWIAFNISIPLGIISVAFSFIAALVCCRATGETDTTPIGAMGKLTQLLYAVLARGNTTTNLMSAGVTACAGATSADLLTDLKSGYLLGANPRKQFIAQFAGVFFGTLAVVPAWYLMVPDAATLEKNFALPNTMLWKAVADLLTQGIHMLPITARIAILIGALVGVLLPVAEKLFPKARPWLPSAMGLGLAWIMPFANAFAFAIGSGITWIWTRLHRKSADTFNIPVASGLVAGESLVAAIIAILCTIIGFAAVRQ